jgi:serine/threonine protein kinase
VLTLEQFLSLVRDSGLLGPGRLDAILGEAGGRGIVPEPSALAQALVADGALTPWQAEKLLAGVHKGFFLGKHKLIRLVATGGMSTVYEAEHILLRRRMALKVLPKSLVSEASYLERFYREARAIARLNHPNIIRGFDVGQDGDYHYFAMEYVEGQSLQDLVQTRGPLPPAEAAEMIRQAALGLEHAHQAGLVHRDIKPANLLLDAGGVVKLLDLGLVRSMGPENDGEAGLTRLHDESLLGTVDYLSPEQAIDSHDVDIRSDIYSLGCTLYFLLTGSPPFPQGTLAEKLLAHQIRPAPPIAGLRPDRPGGLGQVVARMLAKRPEDRYRDPGEVSDVLGDWLIGRPDSAPEAGPSVLPPEPRQPSGSAIGRVPPIARAAAEAAPTTPPTPPPLGVLEDPPTASPASVGERLNPPLAESWRRWAGIFEEIATRRRIRSTLGEASYRRIHEDLLHACRASWESADEPTRATLRRIEDLVAPWLTLGSLKSILVGEMNASLVERFREIDRGVRSRPRFAPSRRLVLGLVAPIAAAALIWSAAPLAWPDPDGPGVAQTWFTNARSALRRMAQAAGEMIRI